MSMDADDRPSGSRGPSVYMTVTNDNYRKAQTFTANVALTTDSGEL